MDLYIGTTKEELKEILVALGFKVTEKEKYFDAKLKESTGRFHTMFTELGDKIYCDLHYDKDKYKWFIGVDYKKKPKELLEGKLRKILEDKNIQFDIEEVSWFTRRNKAVRGGFKL